MVMLRVEGSWMVEGEDVERIKIVHHPALVHSLILGFVVDMIVVTGWFDCWLSMPAAFRRQSLATELGEGACHQASGLALDDCDITIRPSSTATVPFSPVRKRCTQGW